MSISIFSILQNTQFVTFKVVIIILLTTNVYPLKPSEGFPEREFLTNIVQTTIHKFGTNTFKEVRTNSSIVGVYLPIITTNLIPKSSYSATPGQLGQPLDVYIEWHKDSTNANSANSQPLPVDTTSSQNQKVEQP